MTLPEITRSRVDQAQSARSAIIGSTAAARRAGIALASGATPASTVTVFADDAQSTEGAIRSVKKSCVHIVHPDGRLIPFDTYNLFYRDDLEGRVLEPLRRGATALHILRSAAADGRSHRPSRV